MATFSTARELEERSVAIKGKWNFDATHKYDGQPYDAIIFEGGGTKGVVYGGAIRRLSQEGAGRPNIIQHVKCFAGTSAGSQMAVFAALGYNGQELQDISAKAPWDKLLDYPRIINITLPTCVGWKTISKGVGPFRSLWRLKQHLGVCPGTFFEKYVEQLVKKKTHEDPAKQKDNYTFKQLHDERGIHLRVGVCNLVTRQFEMLDYKNYPDMPLSRAARASSSIPLVFYPVTWKDPKTGIIHGPWVDGGLQGNLPIDAFPKTRTLAFDIMTKTDWLEAKERTSAKTKGPKKLKEFITVLVDMVLNSAQAVGGLVEGAESKDQAVAEGFVHVVKIDCGDSGMLETHMDQAKLEEMDTRGWTAVDRFLKPDKYPQLKKGQGYIIPIGGQKGNAPPAVASFSNEF